MAFLERIVIFWLLVEIQKFRPELSDDKPWQVAINFESRDTDLYSRLSFQGDL